MRAVPAILAALLAVLLLPGAARAAGRCGDHPWCDTSLSPEARAGLLLDALTPDERISLLAGDELTGVSGQDNLHTGTSNGVDRVGLPPVYFSDGPVGPRQGKATALPSPISLAATFDERLAARHGGIVGDEAKRKGNDVVYAPAVNMQRTPLNGRTFEYFGEDPFLSSRMAVGWTRGLQAQGVIGNVKHFAVNNQEGQNPSGSIFAPPGLGSRLTVDARLDERTLREIYLAQFEAAVKEAGVGSVMCAYPRVNGAYACENEHLLEDILKEDWRFPGFVLTDYGAAKNTISSLRNGLDLDIWPAQVYRPELVKAALTSGQASMQEVDEHVRRILRTLFAFGFFDRQAYPNDSSTIDQAAHDAEAARLEEAGTVLLENDGGILPLDPARLGKVALIGPEADVDKNGGGSSAINAFRTTTPKQALEARLGAGRVVYDDGSDAQRAAAVARAADVAIVVVGDQMSEGTDKPCMGLNCGNSGPDRDALVEAVAAAQKRTVVVLQTGGPVLTPWRDRVPGLVEAWYPGQNGGTAITRVLLGDAEPGGRLPGTFPLREEDEPVAGDPEKYPGVADTAQYKEGVFIGYRWFDERRSGVAYPFGHGLSYTTFRYSNVRVEPAASGPQAAVRVDVTNTGSRTGVEVPQVYLEMPDPAADVQQPPRVLRGFERMTLAPGETRTATVELGERAFSYWNTGMNRWQVARGCYGVVVGRDSRDTQGRAVLEQGGADCPGAVPRPRAGSGAGGSAGGGAPSRCRASGVLRGAAVRPAGVRRAGLRLRPGGAARIDVFRHSAGRRVLGERLVARFAGRRSAFTWNGRATRRGRAVGDGVYSVRFRTRSGATRRFTVMRADGGFRRRPAFERKDGCGLLQRFKLERPVVGGTGERPLVASYRVASRARVTVELLRGRRVLRRVRARVRPAGRTLRVRFASRRLPRGDVRVRITVRTPSGRRATATLTARRL